MSYEDRISIATPEGIDLDLPLAGLGSRFVATFVDQAIQWAVLLAILIVAGTALDATATDDGQMSDTASLVLGLVVLVAVFLLQFGYHVLFETLAGGRTPGKRWTGIRVVRLGGAPVTFTASVVRNLLRLVDALPGTYLVGMIAILASARNQRLGDMAAGTLVVRERTGGRAPKAPQWMHPELLPEPSEDSLTWDVSAVTADELATVRRFLERRSTLTREARSRLAAELAVRLRPKVVGPDDAMHPEEFLLELAAVKAARG